MNPVIRGLAVYLFVFIIFRFLGKRALSEITTFDFVLLLIISETTTDAMIGEDYSLIACFIMVATLMGTDLLFALMKENWKFIGKITDGLPLVIVDKGKPLTRRMKKANVDVDSVMESARLVHGLEKLEQVKYAVLERDGSISIIPEKEAKD